jgi:hypothetical protein
LTIDSCAWNTVWPTCSQNCVAGNVETLFANLHHTTHHYIINGSRVDAVALNERLHDFGSKIDWVPIFELSVSLATWATKCIDNHCCGHDLLAFIYTNVLFSNDI